MEKLNLNFKNVFKEIEIKEHFKKNIEKEILLDKIYFYLIYQNSFKYSVNYFDSLPTKIFLHYDWKELFKKEINKTIKKIIKLEKSLEIGYCHLPNVKILECEKRNVDVFLHSKTFNEFKNNLSKETFENLIGLFIGHSKFNRFKKNQLRKLNDTYIHFIEKHLEYGLDNYKIEEIEDKIDEIYYFNELKLNEIPDFENTSKLIGLLYYNMFLNTKIKNNNFNLQDIETYRLWTDTSFVDDKIIGKKTYDSYKWNTKKQSDLKIIYKESKIYFPDSNLQSFKQIFDKIPIDNIQPLKTNLSLAELIYFIHLLKENDLINEKKFSASRLESCFIKSDGKSFSNNSIKSTKSQLLNKDLNISSRVLKTSNKDKIELIFKNI